MATEDRFTQNVFGEVTNATGDRLTLEGFPTHSPATRRVLNQRRRAWQEYYETGDVQSLIDVELIPDPEEDAT